MSYARLAYLGSLYRDAYNKVFDKTFAHAKASGYSPDVCNIVAHRAAAIAGRRASLNASAVGHETFAEPQHTVH